MDSQSQLNNALSYVNYNINNIDQISVFLFALGDRWF
jgi:hypothetical protein